MSVEEEKQLAAGAASEMVRDSMRVGLGTGSTVAYLLAALAQRKSRAHFVATSPRTEEAARALGLDVGDFDTLDRLDLAIDGADQVGANGWLIKGAGGAHTREKIVAAAADRFVVIADSTKLVKVLHPPVPLELLSFGLKATLNLIGSTTLRGGAKSPDGGVLADYFGQFVSPEEVAQRLAATPGVVEHGIFNRSLVTDFIVATGDSIRSSTIGGNQ